MWTYARSQEDICFGNVYLSEQLIGRLLTDACFRERAKHDLDSLCVEEGYDLTDTERRIIASLELDRLSRAAAFWLDDRIKRFTPREQNLSPRTSELMVDSYNKIILEN